jgi:hypothetical protein
MRKSLFAHGVMIATLQAGPLLMGTVPGLDPAELRVTTFAANVGFVYGLAKADDGSLLAGVSGSSQGLFDGTPASVLRFVDANFDGIADGPGVPVISGLPGVITAVQRVGSLLAVGTLSFTSSSSQISFFAPGATPDAPYVPVGQLDFDFGRFWEHASPGLAARPTPGVPDSYDVFVNVGSAANHAASGSLLVSGLGLTNVSVPGDSIFLFRIDTGNSVLSSEAPLRVAGGIRNAVAMGFEPESGDFYFADNGIDGPLDFNEPLSADELNRIAAADLGLGTIDFGFPNSYVTYRTGVVVGGGTQPLVAFQPLGNPLTGSESEGAGGLAFSPPGFPSALRGGVFVGFHGKSCCGIANEENPVVYVDLSTGQYYHFISNDDPYVGAIDSLLASGNSLFLADLTTGNIFQITAVPEPASFVLMASAATLLCLRRRTRRLFQSPAVTISHDSGSGTGAFSSPSNETSLMKSQPV